MSGSEGVCRRCGAPIVWLTHEGTGKPAPIDTEPSRIGNIVADLAAGTYRVEKPTAGLRLNHFATCAEGNPARIERVRALARRGGTDAEASAALAALRRIRKAGQA